MKIFFYCLSFCLLHTFTYAQSPVIVNAKIKAATVYFNAVEMTHQVTATLPIGNSELIIKNVANSLYENTVQIAASNDITILSVQFSNESIDNTSDQPPAIKRIKDSILVKTKELAKLKNAETSEQNTIALLDYNKQVFGSNTGLNVLELTKIVDFYKSKRLELSNSIDVTLEKQKKVELDIQLLNNKLQDLNGKEEQISVGKLIIQVMSEKGGSIPLEFSYLSPSATWIPFYDLRAENIESDISLVYKAQITQYTGVDWKKIKLSLSSGMPNQNNQAPLLSAWRLVYSNPYELNQRSVRAKFKSDSRNQAYSNTIQSMEKKMEEVADSGGAPASLGNLSVINDNQLNVSYDIEIPYDVLSNGKVHSVSLKEVKLPVSFKYYAVPKLEKEAFLLAELADYSKYNLLSGEANIIFEGKYVGKTVIEPNQTTDTLNLSMGRDKKISIKREKVVDKSGTKFLSSSKSQTFTYDITVRNGKKETVSLLLKDQYPLSSDKEIEIELVQSDEAKNNAELGVLTWKLKLAPNETKKLRMSYTVKYPKDKVIGNL